MVYGRSASNGKLLSAEIQIRRLQAQTGHIPGWQAALFLDPETETDVSLGSRQLPVMVAYGGKHHETQTVGFFQQPCGGLSGSVPDSVVSLCQDIFQ